MLSCISQRLILYAVHHTQGAKKGKKKLSREEVKQREETLVKEIIADMMDSYGGYEKPQVYRYKCISVVVSLAK